VLPDTFNTHILNTKCYSIHDMNSVVRVGFNTKLDMQSGRKLQTIADDCRRLQTIVDVEIHSMEFHNLVPL
jgi:hypothetical protein